jgi:xanthosine utilization system XapX-like protein
LISIGVGIAAAVIGAVLWAVLVDVTNYKIGYAAVGLGLLVGLAMAKTAGAWRPLPAVAALIALLGCLLGDLFVDAAALASVEERSTISEVADMLTDPSWAREVFSAGFEGLDVAFWAFAALAAFQLTNNAVKARVAAEQAGASVPGAPFAGAPDAGASTGLAGQQTPWSPPPAPAPQGPAPQGPAQQGPAQQGPAPAAPPAWAPQQASGQQAPWSGPGA